MGKRNRLRGFLGLAALAGLVLLVGCRAKLVEVRVVNSGTIDLHNVEVDYPSASFGMSNLAPGATYIYRIQLQDAGHMKVEFSDSKEQPHSGKGPYVKEGQQGNADADAGCKRQEPVGCAAAILNQPHPRAIRASLQVAFRIFVNDSTG